MSDWIDATQRLPERSGEYIVYVGTIGVTTANYRTDPYHPHRPGLPYHWARAGERLSGTVTHWMPLPVGPDGPLVANHPKPPKSAVPSLQTFPIQTKRGAAPHPTRIPWSVADIAYSVYAGRCGRDQSLEELARRGGFSVGEMDDFLPGWRERCDELVWLRLDVVALTRQEHELRFALLGCGCEREDLRIALSTLRSRMDRRMGDTDPSDPSDPDLLAMQAAAAVLDGTPLPAGPRAPCRVPFLTEVPAARKLARAALTDATDDEAERQGEWAYTFGMELDVNPYLTHSRPRDRWKVGWWGGAENDGG